MTSIIYHSSSFEDMVRIVNLLNFKITELKKKIHVLENNSPNYYNNEIILDDNIFKSIPVNAPQLTRQNAFIINI
tara:strand:+ start:1379 stop:1603 length:225 start_codon:yes stop_codon:yes gene_type:complete